MRVPLMVILALLPGCASSFDQMRELREAAPEWYAASRVEIEGRDYRQIRDIPTLGADHGRGDIRPLSGQMAIAARARFLETDRAAPPAETADQMRAWVGEVAAAFDAEVPEPDLLSDQDVARLKARFDVPRAQM